MADREAENENYIEQNTDSNLEYINSAIKYGDALTSKEEYKMGIRNKQFTDDQNLHDKAFED